MEQNTIATRRSVPCKKVLNSSNAITNRFEISKYIVILTAIAIVSGLPSGIPCPKCRAMKLFFLDPGASLLDQWWVVGRLAGHRKESIWMQPLDKNRFGLDSLIPCVQFQGFVFHPTINSRGSQSHESCWTTIAPSSTGGFSCQRKCSCQVSCRCPIMGAASDPDGCST